MAGSRGRTSRKRPARGAATSQPSLEAIPALAKRLLEVLPTPSPPLPAPLTAALSALQASPTPTNQAAAGAALHEHLTRHPPRTPALRQRAAQLSAALPAWHISSPAPALSLFSALAAAAGPSPPDASALTAALLGAANVARSALPTPASRAAVEHATPHLAAPIHAALFRPRTAPLADAHSAQSSGPASSALSDAASIPTPPPRLERARHAALTALTALAAASARALLPAWPLFLPDRPGTHVRSETLAALILFDRDAHTRSLAVTAATALLAASRAFTRHCSAPVRPAAPAFTPASARVLRSTAALHAVAASALRAERAPVVLAKLARLAAELFAAAPVPAVPRERLAELLRALLVRVTDARSTDLTSRAAAASAIAGALAHSGEHVPAEELESVCADLVALLTGSKEGVEHPMAEILAVLRGAVELQPALFRCMWPHGEPRLLLALATDNARSPLVLHCVRLVDTFVSQSVKVYSSAALASLVEDEKHEAQLDLGLTWALYHRLVKDVAQDSLNPAQAAAVLAIGSILQLTGFIGIVAREEDSQGRSSVSSDFCRGQSVAVDEAVEQLKTLALSTCSEVVKVSSLVSLASTPVSCVCEELVLSVFHCLNRVMRTESISPNGRGKAMSSFAILVDKTAGNGAVESRHISLLLDRGTTFAVDFLKPRNSRPKADSPGPGSSRSAGDSSRIAAVNLVACSMRHLLPGGAIDFDPDNQSETSSRDALADVLSDVLRGLESVNTKCVCSRTVAYVLRVEADRTKILASRASEVMLEALEWCLQNGRFRLRLAAASGLKDVEANRRRTPTCTVAAIDLYIRVYRDVGSKLNAGRLEAKERTQLLALQEVLGSCTFLLLVHVDGNMMGNLTQYWTGSQDVESKCSALVDAVFRHLSLPRYLEDYMSNRIPGESKSDAVRNGALLLDSLPLESQSVVKRLSAFRESIKSRR